MYPMLSLYAVSRFAFAAASLFEVTSSCFGFGASSKYWGTSISVKAQLNCDRGCHTLPKNRGEEAAAKTFYVRGQNQIPLKRLWKEKAGVSIREANCFYSIFPYTTSMVFRWDGIPLDQAYRFPMKSVSTMIAWWNACEIQALSVPPSSRECE